MLKMGLNRSLIFLIVILFSNCEKNDLCKDDELSIARTNHTDSLKIDGYYFGDVNSNSSMPFANIYYLYTNGLFFTSEASDLDKAKAGTITVDVENNVGKQIKGLWGLFRVSNNTIEIERWRSRPNGCETIIYERGEILNDTTFVIRVREHRTNGEVKLTEIPNSTFSFRPLAEKPDSTNNFVK